MNAFVIVALIGLAWGSSALCAEPAQEMTAMKVYFVQQTPQAPVLDGALDDAVWQNAQRVDDFGYTSYGNQDRTIKVPRTEARFLWDAKNLYIGLKAFEPDIEKVKSVVANPATAIFWKDLFEVHIDAKHNRKTRVQLMVNPAGEKGGCAAVDKGWTVDHFDATWPLTADWEVAGAYGQDAWTVEARVAFADLDVPPPQIGTHMGINVARFRFVEGTQFLCWTGQGGSHHDKKLWAHMIYVGPEKVTQVLEGLEKAYPDIKERRVFLMVPEGYRVIDHGQESMLTFEQMVTARAAEVKATLAKVREVLPATTTDKHVQLLIRGWSNSVNAVEQAVTGAKTNEVVTYTTSQQAIEKLNTIEKQSESVEWQYKAVELMKGKAR